MAMTKTTKRLTAALAGAFFAGAALAQTPAVPPPGASSRIDAIRKAGVLRVGAARGSAASNAFRSCAAHSNCLSTSKPGLEHAKNG